MEQSLRRIQHTTECTTGIIPLERNIHGRFPANGQNPPADFNFSTPLDFVATNDIIGGNSGSPVLNKDLQVVGLIFDGNIESLPGDIIYVDTYNRSVAVHSDAIPEALKYIYHADRLVNEIKAGKIQQ